MRVLLISDDTTTKELLLEAIRSEGHEIVFSESKAITWRTIRSDLDLLIYDLGEAAPSAWQAFTHWRQLTDLPLIVIGPPAQEENAIRALHTGADDYMARPLRCAELIARCEALVRRKRMSASSMTAVEGEPRREPIVSWRPHQITINGRSVDLTPTEFRLLEVLWQHRGHPVSRNELARQVWGKDEAVAADLSLYIWHLRQKIEEDPKHPKLILTRRRLGYSFQEAEEAKA